jgi:hypothetical protein
MTVVDADNRTWKVLRKHYLPATRARPTVRFVFQQHISGMTTPQPNAHTKEYTWAVDKHVAFSRGIAYAKGPQDKKLLEVIDEP